VDFEGRRQLESAYDICWFPASSKKGYAGAATLSKKELGFTHTKGVGHDGYDAEGRMIVSRKGNLAFIAGYFPNASQGLVRLPFKRQFAKDLAALVAKHHQAGDHRRQLAVAGLGELVGVGAQQEVLDVAAGGGGTAG